MNKFNCIEFEYVLERNVFLAQHHENSMYMLVLKSFVTSEIHDSIQHCISVIKKQKKKNPKPKQTNKKNKKEKPATIILNGLNSNCELK